MKGIKENKAEVEKEFGIGLITNESLNKYKGVEFEPPKLKKIKEKFSKPIIVHR